LCLKVVLQQVIQLLLFNQILPIEIKEKILAAKRANIKEIILCHENKSDIDEIKSEYIEGLTFHYIKEMSELVDVALTSQKVKNAKKL
jgi:ATP-dependent Lon protease